MSLVVVAPGMQALIQDAGRPGFGSSGVSPAGAFDRSALRQADALVANAPDAAGLEVLGGGLRLRATREHLVAVTGAVGAVLVDGHSAEHGRSVVLRPGQELELGMFAVGLRAYVAVAGGFETKPVLGSRSTDTLSGLGPDALTDGTKLRVGFAATHAPDIVDVPALIATGSTSVDVVPGPRDDWFTAAAVAALRSAAWTVSSTSNRIGIRLDGPELERSITDELPSEPCVFGSIQVTSAGQPVALGPDHPVTGGYPVIAVVVDRHLDRLAQVRPGDTVRFLRA
ncbi:MAG TPA: biotin-dependent carboxyltransferase family protein [Aeromicrobium sp.]|nr:biotin-dependent carboxyltransferase family protein [Aeromicrobium sp.]